MVDYSQDTGRKRLSDLGIWDLGTPDLQDLHDLHDLHDLPLLHASATSVTR